MLPDWFVQLSASSGASFIPALSNGAVVALALIAFAVFYAIATLLAADWPSDVAFLALVVGGVLVDWPAMIVLALGSVLFAIFLGVIHSMVAPARTARIAAEAGRRVMPALDEFMRDAGLGDADREKIKGIVEVDNRASRKKPAP